MVDLCFLFSVAENNSISAAANSPTVTADQKQEIEEACDDSNNNDNGDNNDRYESFVEMKMQGYPPKNSSFSLSSIRFLLFFCAGILGC